MPPVIGAVVAIGSAIGSAVGAAGAAVAGVLGVSTAVGTTLVVNGIIMGAEIGISALTRPSPHPDKPHADPVTSQVNVRQPLTYRRIIYGSVRVAGVITFIALSGANNDYLHVIYTLAGHQVSGIGTMYLDGTAVPLTLSGNYYVPTGGTYQNFVWVEEDLGDPLNSSQPFPQLHADVPAWTNACLQRNCAKIHVRFKWDQNVWPNGLPASVAFDVNGKPIFDPRTSTTVLSNNPALVLRDFLTDTTYGMGVPATTIDDNATITAANICDELVPLKAGGNQTRYTCDGVVDASGARGDVIKMILSSMAGWIVPPGDTWRIYAGAYVTPTVILTQDDLRGPLKLDTRISRRELANGITGTYVSPGNKWQPSNFPPYQSATYLSNDGGTPIWKDIQLPFTTDGVRAQRLAKIELERLRHEQTLTLACKLSAFVLDPGDTVMFTFDPLGYNQKIFEVVQTNLVASGGSLPGAAGDSIASGAGGGQDISLPALGVDLILREMDASVYIWTPATDEGTVTNPSATTVPSLLNPAPPTGVGAQSGASTAIIRQDGLRHDRIVVTWTQPADVNVTSGGKINIFFTEHSTGNWRLAGQADGADTEFYILDVIDGESYDIKLQSVNTARATSAFVEVDNLVATGGTTDYVGNLPAAAYGRNLLGNSGFENNTIGTLNTAVTTVGDLVCDGWELYTNSSGLFQVINESSNGRNSTHDLLIRLPTNVNVPNGTYDCQVLSTAKIPLQYGDYVGWRYYTGTARSAVAPAGISFTQFWGLALFNNSDAIVGFYFNQLTPSFTGFTQYQKAQVFNTSSVAYARAYVQTRVTNTGSTVNTGTQLWCDARWDDMYAGVQSTTLDITPANSGNTPTGTNLCTQSGTSTTILTAAFTMQYPFAWQSGQISYNSSSVNPGAYGTYYVTMDDPTFSGGSIAPNAWLGAWRISAAEGRIYLGKITTTSGGGGGSGGSGGGGACFSPNTLITTTNGNKPIAELQRGDLVWTSGGWRPVAKLLEHDFDDIMLDMGSGELITEQHAIWHEESWVPALYTGHWNRSFTHYKGKVYNITVETNSEDERNYTLANGVRAHNAIK